MKHLKKLLYSLLMCSQLQASDTQFWFTYNTRNKLSENVNLQYANEIRFTNHLDNMGYYHFEPLITHRVHKDSYVGLQARIIETRKETGDWTFEFRPGFVMLYKFNLGFRPLYFRTKLKARIFRFKPSHAATRTRFRVPLVYFTKDYYWYVEDEFYYNHNNIQSRQIDRNRFATGLKGKINKDWTLQTYYLWQANKGGARKAWKSTHVMAFKIYAYF